MKSLRARALAGGAIWAIMAVLIGVYGLSAFLEAQTQRRFDEMLTARHTRAIVALANSSGDPENLVYALGEPAYIQPFSGEYWQIANGSEDIYVSRSLMDTLLPVPDLQADGVRLRDIVISGGEKLRSAGQWVTLDNGSQWHVQVASSLASLSEDRNVLRNNLLLAYGAVVIFGVIGAILQVSAMLRPLGHLRSDVLARWDSDGGLQVKSYPIEVAPLVEDINTLLDRNRDIVSRSRRQAADLAHAIKTPSAIVRNELEKLRGDGQDVSESLIALDRLDAQLKRSFARMRADGGNAGVRPVTDLDRALGRLGRAFTALARNHEKVLQTDIAPGLQVPMDQTDFEEVMGNLLDNALKWSARQINITAKRVDKCIVIAVGDDGPGISEQDRAFATSAGRRLDTSKPGTGLGLSLAADLTRAYGGSLELGVSDALGGLQVLVTLPVSGL